MKKFAGICSAHSFPCSWDSPAPHKVLGDVRDIAGAVAAAISSRHLDIPVSEISADNESMFGRWLRGSELSDSKKQREHYRKAKQLHTRFHEDLRRWLVSPFRDRNRRLNGQAAA